jgi:hypothetical protein
VFANTIVLHMQVQMTRTSFHYKELTDEQIMEKGRQHYGHFKYRLMRIETTTYEKQLQTGGIERSTICGADLSHLQVFNEVFIPECNADCFRIVFHELCGERHVYSLSKQLLVKEEEEAPTGNVSVVYPDQGEDGDAYFAASGNTILHDYVETRPGRFFHVGISFMPTGPLFVPLWLCNARMERLVFMDWPRANDIAKKEALVVIRFQNGCHSIRHVLNRPVEKHA